MSGLETSGGATRKAPATGRLKSGMPWIAVGTPSEWATSTTGRSALFTALTTLAVQSSCTGLDHSACSTRRADDSFLSHRLCQ